MLERWGKLCWRVREDRQIPEVGLMYLRKWKRAGGDDLGQEERGGQGLDNVVPGDFGRELDYNLSASGACQVGDARTRVVLQRSYPHSKVQGDL